MTAQGNVLNDFRAWFAAHEASLAADGYHMEFKEAPSDRAKLSASVIITSARRIGQLVIWETGEAELSMGDVASDAVMQEHREITSEIGLRDATETLVAWLREFR
jgi:hypothetical protein